MQQRLYPSDHRPVVVHLQPPGTPTLGKGRWRFPSHLLGVEAFCEQLRSKLSDARTALEQRSPRLDPAAEWEHLKGLVQGLCEQLQRQLKEQQRRERSRLWGQLLAARRYQRWAGNAQSEQRVLEAEQAVTALESAELAQQTAATEPLWDVYGEQSTFWFHQLGRAAQEPQSIAAVQRPDGTLVAAQGAGIAAVGELLADYYDPAKGGLFSCHPTDREQQDYMLAALDQHLDEEQQQQCSGEEEDGTAAGWCLPGCAIL